VNKTSLLLLVGAIVIAVQSWLQYRLAKQQVQDRIKDATAEDLAKYKARGLDFIACLDWTGMAASSSNKSSYLSIPLTQEIIDAGSSELHAALASYDIALSKDFIGV